MRQPCLKQKTRCTILTGGQRYEATSTCDVEGTECPRIAAGCPTGEGYELCDSLHAEANAAALVPDDNIGGTAYLYGHDWLCGPCQKSLQAKGIRTFVVTGEEA